ncbi:hypothetical protein DOTSEDRAFT_70807 [Dothistroma septosporum NZE10]|uniref:Uncharacterized protein n=1 Tax=Dothistroma septosporum (strain NZE10 / CBS 128990) TaxID=675120 RepID=N1PR88_DOTSN|nr:hypothetical protein DOTSEDRAFT_70807 [Dothistroma septosporum NZE10]
MVIQAAYGAQARAGLQTLLEHDASSMVISTGNSESIMRGVRRCPATRAPGEMLKRDCSQEADSDRTCGCC